MVCNIHLYQLEQMFIKSDFEGEKEKTKLSMQSHIKSIAVFMEIHLYAYIIPLTTN